MPHPSSVNPRTGKTYGWEARERERNAAQIELKQLEADRKVMLRQQAILRAQKHLLDFTKFTMPDPEDPNDINLTKYEAAKFHEIIAAELDKFLNGEMKFENGETCTQLIFCMPPRHGKTELATKRLAAFYSGRHPAHDIIVAAAGDDLANDFGSDVRANMHSPAFKQVFPGHKLRRGGNAKDNIQTDQGGRLIFAGRGGQINGRGAHLLLVDDLYKDATEARSQAVRDSAWDWFVKVALYRRVGKRLTIITMTRWHSDDIIGRLTDPENPHYNADEAADWKIIRLPGLAEEDDPLGRAPGEALWPEKRKDGSCFDVDYHLKNQRRDPLGFAALTQQRPTVADGILFRRENIRRYDIRDMPEDMRFYCASDHAVNTTQRNDFSCFVKGGIDRRDDLYLTELFWERAKSDAAVEAMLTMGSGSNKPLIWWAEKGHISQSIGPFLYKRMLETGNYIQVVEVTPSKDKAQRAQSISARVAMGKVYIPNGPIWDRAIEEMMAFPNGNRDDFCDAIAHLGMGLQSMFGRGAPAPLKNKATHGTFAWLKQNDAWHDAKRKAAKAIGEY